MKNLLIFLLTSTLVFLVGCGGDDPSSSKPVAQEKKAAPLRPAEPEEIESLVDLVKFQGNSWSFSTSFKEDGCKGTGSMEIRDLGEKGLLISYEIKGKSGTCISHKSIKDRFLTRDRLTLNFLENTSDISYGEDNGRKFLNFKSVGGGKVEEIKVFYSAGSIEYPMLANISSEEYLSYSTINISLLPKDTVALNLSGVNTTYLYFEDAIDLFQSIILEFKESL